jgi:hypothetical protein
MAHQICLNKIKNCDCINDDIKRLAILENLWQELKAKHSGKELHSGYWKIKEIIAHYRKQLE